MHITWLGLTCLKIQTKNSGEDIVLLTDPFSEKTGLKPPRLKADLVAVSRPTSEQANNLNSIIGSPFIINSAGEYEIKGVFVYSIPKQNGETDQSNFFV